MRIDQAKTAALITTVVLVVLLLIVASAAQAEEAPIKLVLSGHIGWEVDKTTHGNFCSLSSGDECQPGTTGGKTGGFEYPEGVAGAPDGDVYVTDPVNHRVEEFTSGGEFILMFGKDVNATTAGNICTADEIQSSKVVCQKGLSGSSQVALAQPGSIAVDPDTKDVYVQDSANWRVDEYTAGGEFILTIGREVNETEDDVSHTSEAERNVCTAISLDSCKAGVQSVTESTEEGAFNFLSQHGNLLAVQVNVGGNILYVGDEHRVEEFSSSGAWKGEIKLSPQVIASVPNAYEGYVTGVAASNGNGGVDVVYGEEPIVREFSSLGIEEHDIDVGMKEADVEVTIRGIALDSSGRLAVAAAEVLGGTSREIGYLYRAGEASPLTEFAVGTPLESAGSEAVLGLGFDGNGDLYGVVPARHEIVEYMAERVGEITTSQAVCDPGREVGTSNTFDCSLDGSVDPYGVTDTKVWIEWGDDLGGVCTLSHQTPDQNLAPEEAPLQVAVEIEGLRPNAAFCYRLVGTDQNVQSPETLTGSEISFNTPSVSPRVIGGPSSSFVTQSSAVLRAELNPENAPTEYFFEYGQSETLKECAGARTHSCPGVISTASLESETYGSTGATFEASGLQPEMKYHYRLTAVNKAGESASGAEGDLVTSLAIKVQAETGAYYAVTPTSALVTGTVNPDGQPATYTFELGIYRGTVTQYVTVVSGTTGVGTSPEAESVGLIGLEPGTTYAYRVTIHSGYGSSIGDANIFTTTPVQLAAPPPMPIVMLPIPKGMEFPVAPAVKICKKGLMLNKQHMCVAPKRKTKAKAKSKKKVSRRKK